MKIKLPSEAKWVVGVTAVAFTLRLLFIGQESLWLDELFSVFLVRKSWLGVIQGTAQDILPPLYYLLLKIMMQFGDNEIAARALSAIASTATVPIMYQLGKRLFDQTLALTAATILAINPFHVIYAQEARMYTLFGLFSLLSVYFFWQAWQDGQRKLWSMFVAVTILAFYTHSLAFLNLLALDLFALTQWKRLKEQWRIGLLSHVIIVAAFLPWVSVILQQTSRLSGEFAGQGQSPATLLTAMFLFLFGTTASQVVTAVAFFVLLTLLAFAVMGILYRQTANTSALLYIILIYTVPVLGLYLISFQSPIFVERRLLPASFGLYFLLAWVISRAKPRRFNQILGVILAGTMLASLSGYYLGQQKIPIREAAQSMAEQLVAGDTIIHLTDTSALAFAFYEPTLPNHFLAGDPDYLAETNRGRAQRIAGLVPESPDAITVEHNRFWLIVVLDHQIEYQTQRVAEFDGRYQRMDQQNIGGIDLILYAIN